MTAERVSAIATEEEGEFGGAELLPGKAFSAPSTDLVAALPPAGGAVLPPRDPSGRRWPTRGAEVGELILGGGVKGAWKLKSVHVGLAGGG